MQMAAPVAVPTPIPVAVPVPSQVPMFIPTPVVPAVSPVQTRAVPQPTAATPLINIPTIASPRAGNTRTASWVPHPHLHPSTSSNIIWTPTILHDTKPIPGTPQDANSAMRLTGGWPLPGTMTPTWTFSAWPPSPPSPSLRVVCPIILCPWIIPNPCSNEVRHILWDVAQSPVVAKRRSSRWTISPLHDKFGDQATYPAVGTVHIVCDIGAAKDLWGPIVVSANRVTAGDIFFAIYNYFQTPVPSEEADAICMKQGLDIAYVMRTFAKRCARAIPCAAPGSGASQYPGCRWSNPGHGPVHGWKRPAR